MANVHKELSRNLQQHDDHSFEEFSTDLEEKNKTAIFSKKKDEKQPEPVTDKRKMMINKIQLDLLRTILPTERNSTVAVKYMRIIRDNHMMMLTIQEDLLERKDDSFADSFRKLENVNEIKWSATLDAWGKEKRSQTIFYILVDQVRKIRTRRCPQMAGKIMRKLQDRQLVLKKLQEELMKRVKERANMRQTKKTIEEELLMEIKRKEEIKRRRKMLEMKLMSYHFERAVEENTHFIPRRKLFLNSVETFKTVPKLEEALKVVEPSVSIAYEDQPQPQPKRGTRTRATLKSRIKRIFGFR